MAEHYACPGTWMGASTTWWGEAGHSEGVSEISSEGTWPGPDGVTVPYTDGKCKAEVVWGATAVFSRVAIAGLF